MVWDEKREDKEERNVEKQLAKICLRERDRDRESGGDQWEGLGFQHFLAAERLRDLVERRS